MLLFLLHFLFRIFVTLCESPTLIDLHCISVPPHYFRCLFRSSWYSLGLMIYLVSDVFLSFFRRLCLASAIGPIQLRVFLDGVLVSPPLLYRLLLHLPSHCLSIGPPVALLPPASVYFHRRVVLVVLCVNICYVGPSLLFIGSPAGSRRIWLGGFVFVVLLCARCAGVCEDIWLHAS